MCAPPLDVCEPPSGLEAPCCRLAVCLECVERHAERLPQLPPPPPPPPPPPRLPLARLPPARLPRFAAEPTRAPQHAPLPEEWGEDWAEGAVALLPIVQGCKQLKEVESTLLRWRFSIVHNTDWLIRPPQNWPRVEFVLLDQKSRKTVIRSKKNLERYLKACAKRAREDGGAWSNDIPLTPARSSRIRGPNKKRPASAEPLSATANQKKSKINLAWASIFGDDDSDSVSEPEASSSESDRE